MNRNRRAAVRAAILAIIIVGAAMAAMAQRGTSVVTRTKFPRGRTTVVVSSAVRLGMSHDYLLKARAGQTITVHLAVRGGVRCDILTPSGDYLAQYSRDWSSDLPESGDYRINVLPDTRTERSVSYTLEVTVR